MKKFSGGEMFLGQKNSFGSKKIGSNKCLDQENFWVDKNFPVKIFFGWQILGLKKICSKRSLGRKILGVEKNLDQKKFLIGGQEIREIIPFPVWIIPFPIFKTSFKLVDKIEKHFVKEVF